MIDGIRKDVLDLKKEMIRLRRDFHMHPELAMEEERTARVITGKLSELGIRVESGIGKTGVVGVLEGDRPGKTILLRADMDALPIQEKNEIEYKSKIDGVMHACGHDGHMAILLAAAKILNAKRNDFFGKIKLVFQPGEEGSAGARFMVEDGVMENPKVDAAFALHLMTSYPVGSVLVRAGPTMACMDSFTVTINGKGGHGAKPNEGVDAILVSANVISALQTLISKEVCPLAPLVIHVGEIRGGCGHNIIADEVEFKGTVRTHDETLRNSMPDRIDRIIRGVTTALRGTHKLDYRFDYPPVINDAAMSEVVRGVSRQVVGKHHVMESPQLMASDDMAFFLNKVPGCYFFIGAGNAEKNLEKPHHNPYFNFDEDALLIGAEMMVLLALNYLKVD